MIARALLLSTLLCAAAAQAMSIGDRVTYTDVTGAAWCATVAYVAPGTAGRPYAWITIDRDPRRVVSWPVAELVAGCK